MRRGRPFWGIALVCLVLATAHLGCDRARSIPRLDPTLANWPRSYVGLDGLRLHVFETGTIAMPEAAVFRGGSWFSWRRLDVPAFVIEHPTAGLIVFDTGLGAGGGGMLGRLGIVHASGAGDLVSQMRDAGLGLDRVRYVVASHLHFDHPGALSAFRRATVVTGRGERYEAAQAGAASFYRRTDWEDIRRWTEIDYGTGAPFATFSSHHDLLGDGSIVLVDLHGHTHGSQGLLLRAPGGPILLTGDAAWVEESWRYAATPIWAEDMDGWWEQVWRIKKLVERVPSLLVVPGHDLARLRKVDRADVVVHAPAGDG